MVAPYNDPVESALMALDRLWLLGPAGEGTAEVRPVDRRLAPKGVIMKLSGHSTREAAESLRGLELAADRALLPEPGPEEYYHADLAGLTARTASGRPLGRVVALMDAGAAPVLVIADEAGKESLVPFTDEFVPSVDLAAGLLTVAEIPGLLD
jgi:16S rRNA processing protein RimM